VIEREGDRLRLNADLPLAELLSRNNEVAKFLGERQSERVFEVNAAHRGVLKQALLAAGYPEDLAGYVAGDALDTVALNCSVRCPVLVKRLPKKEAAAVFYQAGRVRAACDCLALWSRKNNGWTGCNLQVKENTLVLTSSLTSVRQWKQNYWIKRHCLQISEYSGESKQTGPVTLATYQIELPLQLIR